MKSFCDGLVVVSLMLAISSIVQTRVSSRAAEDCDDFSKRGAAFYLPDDIISWNELPKLQPCCMDGADILRCVTCNDNVIWKLTRKDRGLTVCTVVPNSIIAAMDMGYESRRGLVATPFHAGSKSRNIDSIPLNKANDKGARGRSMNRKSTQYSDLHEGYAGMSNPPGSESFYRSKNNQGFQQGINRPYNLEQPPVYVPNTEQAYAPLSPPAQQPLDTGFLGNLLSHLFFPERPVGSTLNVTGNGQNNYQGIPVDCIPQDPPVYGMDPNQYVDRDFENLPSQPSKNDGDHSDQHLWNNDNTGHLPVPPSKTQAQDDSVNMVQEQAPLPSQGNTNMNINTNRMTSYRKDVQPHQHQQHQRQKKKQQKKRRENVLSKPATSIIKKGNRNQNSTKSGST